MIIIILIKLLKSITPVRVQQRIIKYMEKYLLYLLLLFLYSKKRVAREALKENYFFVID